MTAAPRVDVVYYLRYGDRIKIGTSANPRRRIAALPHDEVLAFERGDRALEQARHRQFAAHRIPHTEWFEANQGLADLVAAVSRGVTDPWSLYSLWVSEAIALRA
ncbi:GIY-YIG nuclease family protein [Lacisediminihabitans changchengi]|nr:GIY-YIG nuclease family protein [Lacisediminihabitans changchengi]